MTQRFFRFSRRQHFSCFTDLLFLDHHFGGKGSAIGRVSGVLELAAVPPIGSSVVLAHPTNGIQPITAPGFSGMIKVTDLRFEPVSSSAVDVAVSLEDVIVASIEDGRELMSFFEKGFGLSGEEYEFDQ